MTIQRQTVDINIDGGMDEGVDPRRATKPTLLENVRYTKTGSLGKRPGSSCLGRFNLRLGGGTPSTPELLTVRGPELVRTGGMVLDSFLSLASTDWAQRGLVGLPPVRRTTIASSDYYGTDPDVAVSADYATTVYVYGARDGIRATIVQASTGARYDLLVATTSVSGAGTPKVIIIGTTALVTYWNTSANKIDVTAIGLTAHTVGTTLHLFTLAGVVGYFDVCLSSQGELVVVAMDAISIFVARVDTAPSVVQTTTIVEGTAQWVACSESGGSIWFATAAGGTVSYRAVSSTNVTASVYAKTTFAVSDNGRLAILATSASTAIIAGSGGTGAGTQTIYAKATGLTIGTLYTVPYTVLLSKIWTYGSRYYVCVCPTNQAPLYQGLCVAVELGAFTASAGNSATVVGAWAIDEVVSGGSSASVRLGVTSVAASSATAFRTTLQLGSSIGGIQGTYVDACDFDYATARTAVDVSGVLALTGATPFAYDGARPTEIGFVTAPAAPTLAGAAGGSLTSSATYTYATCFKYRDVTGRVYRSRPSPTVAVTLTSGQSKVTYTYYTLTLTARDAGSGTNRPAVEVYRTLANGETLYKVAEFSNNTAVGSVASVDDTLADSAISSNPVLYTTGGDLEASPAPSAGHTFYALGRLWLADTDNDTVWPSDTLLTGEGPRFNPVRSLPAFGGARTVAGVELDDSVVLFKRDSIWRTAGVGPDATGNGDFAPIARVSSEFGCIDPRTIVSTSDGIWFQSRAGLCLLTRGFQVLRDGRAVEDSAGTTLATPTAITAAVAVPDQTELRFTVATEGVERAVVYDTQLSQPGQPVWSRYAWTCPIGGSPTIASACYYAGAFTWITSSGYIFHDDATTYLDTMTGQASAWVTATFDLPLFHGERLQDFWTILEAHVLGEARTIHNLNVYAYQDYATTSPYTKAFTNVEIAAMPRAQLGVQLQQTQCEALRVKITDATPTSGVGSTTGEGFRLTGVALDVAMNQGLYRLIAAAKK